MMDKFLSYNKLPISLHWKTGKPNGVFHIIPITHFMNIFVDITTQQFCVAQFAPTDADRESL